MSTSTICKTKKTIVVSMSPIWSALKCLLLYSNPLVKTISYLMSSDPSHYIRRAKPVAVGAGEVEKPRAVPT